MKLGIMQPYFFPYVGYYDLINRTDRWVVFDVVKYTPKSWMNRNRILHPSDGWQYITVPVDKHQEDGAIKDVLLVDKAAARSKVLGQLEHYRRGRAPFFSTVRDIAARVFDETGTNKLRDLNVASLRVVCEYLNIPFDAYVLSEAEIVLPEISHPGQWALEISDALGADSYLNPPGGRDIFRPHEWAERGIELEFTELLDFRYACGTYEFVERLSIVDVLMWNSPETVKAYLDDLKRDVAA